MEKIPNIEKIDNEKALRDIERGICEPLYRPEEIDFVEITKRAKELLGKVHKYLMKSKN